MSLCQRLEKKNIIFWKNNSVICLRSTLWVFNLGITTKGLQLTKVFLTAFAERILDTHSSSWRFIVRLSPMKRVDRFWIYWSSITQRHWVIHKARIFIRMVHWYAVKKLSYIKDTESTFSFKVVTLLIQQRMRQTRNKPHFSGDKVLCL